MEQDNKENNQNKQNEFKTVTFNTDKSFKNVTKEKKNSTGFGKAVALPFLCGVLGAGVVVGTCFVFQMFVIIYLVRLTHL